MGGTFARAGSLLLVVAVAGCGSPPPPPRPPPAMKKNAPFEGDVSGHHLVVRFADSLASGDQHFPPRVAAIELDGNTLYPRDCAAKSKTKPLACSPAHRAVKNADDLHVIANHGDDKQLQLLIAGRAGNNLECGAVEYWVLRVDKSGASASEPTAGCFTLPSLDPDAQNPVVEWGPPLTVRTFDEKSQPYTLVLAGNAWKQSKGKHP